ncbi:MAG: hypothetical protein RL154_272 [Pseudomonadota bacterium]|jgi:two-component system OmpR family response regulator
MKIILTEDDGDISLLLKEFLESYHMYCTNFANAKDSIEALKSENFELAIIDLGLPEISGFELCKHIALNYGIPIIIFSARDNLNDKLRALELGADDYIVKTAEPLEIVARIKAVMRRCVKEQDTKQEKQIFRLNEDAMVAFKNGVDLELSRYEYELLRLLIKNQRQVIEKSMIADELKLEQNSRNIDMLISRLRQKIEEDHKKPQYLKNVWGVGYKFIC